MKKEELDKKTRAWISSLGGKARSNTLTAAERTEIAKAAARKRWEDRTPPTPPAAEVPVLPKEDAA